MAGHHDPAITQRCMERFEFDTVLIPVNLAEPADRSFVGLVIPVAQERGMGIVAMKTYLRGMASRIPGYESMEPFFRFALSQPVSTAVIGCDSVEQLEENVGFAISFTPMSRDEAEALVKLVAPSGAASRSGNNHRGTVTTAGSRHIEDHLFSDLPQFAGILISLVTGCT